MQAFIVTTALEFLFAVVVLTKFVLSELVSNVAIIIYLSLRTWLSLSYIFGAKICAGYLKARFPRTAFVDFVRDSNIYSFVTAGVLAGVLSATGILSLLFAALYFLTVALNQLGYAVILHVYDKVEPIH
jgi:hypothetical protein